MAVMIHLNIRCTEYFFPSEYVSYSLVREPNIGEYNTDGHLYCCQFGTDWSIFADALVMMDESKKW